jgi:hypothetical protein
MLHKSKMNVPSADIIITVKSSDGSDLELAKESRFISAVQR